MPVHNFLNALLINRLCVVFWVDKSCVNTAPPVDYLCIKSANVFFHRLSTLSCQRSKQIQVIIIDTLIALAQRRDASTTVQNGRMVSSTKGIADLREAMIG